MAVSAQNTEVKTVLEISTGNSPKSIKELRQQIKSLKDELVGLDEGSQAYSDTLVALGEKMHTLKEINEQVARTNRDFGDTVSNISNVVAGGVAAVQGLTAGLSLLGVEMGDDDKLTQTLVKSMALLQSLSSMDKAIKSMKALGTVMKSNIAMAGGLSKALKALAVNNPFIAIAAGAAAVTAAVVALINHNKKLAEAEREVKAEADAAARSILYMQQNLNFTDTEARFRYAQDGIQEAADQTRRSILDLVGEMNRQNPNNQEENWGKAINQAYDAAVKAGDKYKATLIEIVQQQHELRGYEGQMLRGEITKAEYAAKEAEYNQKNYNTYKSYIDAKTKKGNKAAKEEVDLAKQQYELARKRLDLQRQLDSNALEANYQKEIAAAQGNADELLRIDQEYTKKRTELNRKYYTDAIALAEKFKETRKKEADIVAVETDIAKLTESLNNGEYAWAEYTREQEKARKEKELTTQQLKAEIAALDQETERIGRNAAMQRAFNQETIDYLNEANDKYGIFASSMTAYYTAERQFQQQMLELEMQHADLLEDRTNLDNQLQQLQSQYEQGLIAFEEYEKQKAEIRQQYAEVEAQLDENEVEQEKTKLNRKIELNQAYRTAINNITGDLVSLLNSISDAEGVSFEDSKKMKIAAATISTIQGGINAFMGYLDSGIPQPMASILGAAAAASTVAMGMMEIQKIRNTKPGNSNASASTSAVQVVQTPTQMTNITGLSDNIELPDQRVYVVYDDIRDAGNRVSVVTNNSEI